MPRIIESPSSIVLKATAIRDRDRDTASRYIAAIVARDRQASLDPASVEWRRGLLWDRFVAGYADVTSGPYARHGCDALRVAMERL